MLFYTTKQVAELLGVPYAVITKAIFKGAVKKPAERIGKSYQWTSKEVEKASWAINHRPSGVSDIKEDNTETENLDNLLIEFEVMAKDNVPAGIVPA